MTILTDLSALDKVIYNYCITHFPKLAPLSLPPCLYIKPIVYSCALTDTPTQSLEVKMWHSKTTKNTYVYATMVFVIIFLKYNDH